MGWARRTSAYVAGLRKLGFPILTVRETVGDASVGRYVLCPGVSQGREAISQEKGRAEGH